MRSNSIALLGVALGLSVLAGCSTAQKQTPHMSYSDVSVQAQFGRKDFVVLNSVEGSSTVTSILLGLVQFVDGDNLKVLGIPFFVDKYTYFRDNNGLPIIGEILNGILGASAVDRAYYKALEKSPQADVVLVKSYDNESSGIPLLYTNEVVTVRGKAMAIQPDR